ncbi:hypothetical protein [Streptomyces otsuchiensis]|uniref:hypothetical protein n=1 Tax=Streptomyces otsuchiensis TaxID=2681388 RepID=UPI0010324EA2|nr:hypothetical protein [Streptomyces otsuchiensis]
MEAGPRDRDDSSRAGPMSPGRLGPLPLPDAVHPSDPGSAGPPPEEPAESYEELRPPRRLRLIQLAPIVLLSLLGALMFAFPLAFAFGDGGAVVAMLGLLIGSSAAGWGVLAARRVGYTWPGLPPRGSGNRPDWRLLALYAVGLLLVGMLALWRVAGLR